METRNVNKGISKDEFENQKEYSFSEAREILGPCKRKKLCEFKQEQHWEEGGVWETETDAGTYPRGWFDHGDPKILEEYDVWINERGDMLLAQPLPENTLNIKDFEF